MVAASIASWRPRSYLRGFPTIAHGRSLNKLGHSPIVSESVQRSTLLNNAYDRELNKVEDTVMF